MGMDWTQAKEEVKQRISCTRYLEPSKGGMYCCPFCGSGHGNNKTGAVKYYEDTNTICCFGKCGKKSYDVIDLCQKRTGTDYNTALSLLADEIGIKIDTYTPQAYEPKSDRAENIPAEAPADYTEYYKECRERLNDPAVLAYLKKRGISPETAKAYWLGYDPEADPASAPGGNGQKYHPTPRLIIPTTKSHYVGRRIDGKAEYPKINSKGTSPGIFNLKAIYSQGVQEVFITEGAIDALSIIETGSVAIGLNSTSNADAFISQLETQKSNATFILSLDNDEGGKKATQTIKEGLTRLDYSFISENISGEYKDPNEALTEDRDTFISAIEKARHQTALKPDNTQYYIDEIMGSEIEEFKQEIKTGFDVFDSQVGGGLYSGLYVLAAISSLGKTSFVLQVADQIAESGNDVIFFSLEQSRLELVSKSIARRTAQNDIDSAVTSLQIRKGYTPPQVQTAAKEYSKAVGDRVSIKETNMAGNISFMREYVQNYIRRTNTRPVVIVDYLQILQPEETEKRKQTTKDVVDNTITELRQLARKMSIPIIAISSVNRANYLTPIDFESLKESGNIEFSADVVLGLQLQCLNGDIFNQEKKIKEKRDIVKRAKRAEPRQIELVCLKNRYGRPNFSCYFNYYAKYDLFEEVKDTENSK